MFNSGSYEQCEAAPLSGYTIAHSDRSVPTKRKRVAMSKDECGKDGEGRVKRPPNSFFLYARRQRTVVSDTLRRAAGDAATMQDALWKMAEQSYHSQGPAGATSRSKRRIEKCTVPSEEWLGSFKTSLTQPFNWRDHTELTISNSIVSQIVGRQWSHMKATDPAAAATYEMEQTLVAETHKVDNPDYKYKPGEKKQKAKKVGRPKKKANKNMNPFNEDPASAHRPSDLTFVQLSNLNNILQMESTKQARFQSWLQLDHDQSFASSTTPERAPRLAPATIPLPFGLSATAVAETLATLSTAGAIPQQPLFTPLLVQDDAVDSLYNTSSFGGSNAEESAFEFEQSFNGSLPSASSFDSGYPHIDDYKAAAVLQDQTVPLTCVGYCDSYDFGA
jgi:hypothetical protein